MAIKLTKNLKAMIAQKFKAGASIDMICEWYDKPRGAIEQVLREVLGQEAGNLTKATPKEPVPVPLLEMASREKDVA